MTLSNKDIAQIFDNIADMLEIQGESRFKFLSYRRAAETIRDTQRDLSAYVADGTLKELPGVGKAISEKIIEVLDTGKMDFYEKRKAEVPLGVLEIKRITGVGPKKAKLFWDALDITSIPDLKAAAEAQKLRELSGMGAKSEQKILDGIAALEKRSERTLLGIAKPIAEDILALLLELPEAQEGVVAGSIRRGKVTIGDVDILIAGDNAQPIMERFVNMANVERILGYGSTKSSVELDTGLQVDVRVLPKSRWGTALQYFTGSQQHNIRIREIARQQNLSLNEEALRPLDENGYLIDDESQYIFCETEEKVYETLGLPWIAPELREDNGEIEAAKNDKLPNLITLADLRGDLHMHTTYTDGRLPVRGMIEAAIARGREYIVITDHSQYSRNVNGLTIERLWQQREEVQAVAEEVKDQITVLHGIELDLLPDGSLDYPDDVLEKLDFVIASIHTSFKQEKDIVTRRVLNAIENPHIDLIGHPMARRMPKRPPLHLDMDVIIAAAAEHKTALEINGNPERLDLDAEYARAAIQSGVVLAINSDAHSDMQMDRISYGVITARRGWVTAESVINAWPYEKFIDWVNNR